MTLNSLYHQIHSLIANSLYVSYNKNTSRLFFAIPDRCQLDQKQFTFENFKLNCEETLDQTINIQSFRLPQTRIYYSELCGKSISIGVVEYFDTTVFLFANKSQQKIRLEIDQKSKGLRLLEPVLNKTLKKPGVMVDAQSNLVLYSIPINSSIQKTSAQFLSDLIKNEKVNHPLNRIYSQDIKFLKKIDLHWVNIKSIGPLSIETSFNLNENSSLAKLILLQELYNMLGWSTQFTELQNSVNSKNQNVKDFFDFPKKEIDNHKGKSLNIDSMTFTYIYLNNITDGQIIEKIQSFWDRFSLPAYNIALEQVFHHQPSELIAFLILAFKCNFWWSIMAFNYIKDIVSRKDPEVYNIICLLFTIISKVSIWCEQGIYYIRFFQSNLDKNGINFNNDKLNVKSVLIRNSEIYKVSHINFPNFSIDKNVLFKIDKEKKNIVFVPNLFQYKLPTGNVIDIEYDSFTFSVPLIWRIFVVNIGEARIKFLFKKRRYQISIKGAAHIKRFVIGNNSISFENNKYHTIYYVPMKIDVESQVYFFNEKGEALNLEKWTYSHSSAGVHGIFLDSYGHLSDEIQFQKNLSKKNMNVKAIANPIDTIPVKDPFYLWIRKGIKYKFSGIPCSKYVQKILECDAILLKMGLTIFFDKTVKERDQILNCFYANFGFLPKSEELENLNLKNYMFNIIVSDKNLGTEISSSILSKEILLKKNGSKKAILISPQNVISWLDNAFYMIN